MEITGANLIQWGVTIFCAFGIAWYQKRCTKQIKKQEKETAKELKQRQAELDKQLKDYQARIDSSLLAINKKVDVEYKVFPELWMKIQEPRVQLSYFINLEPIWDYINKLSQPLLDKFLKDGPLPDLQNAAVKQSKNPGATFYNHRRKQLLIDAGKALLAFERFHLYNQLFISKELSSLFNTAHTVMARFYNDCIDLKGGGDRAEILENGQRMDKEVLSILEQIEKLIRSRLELESELFPSPSQTPEQDATA